MLVSSKKKKKLSSWGKAITNAKILLIFFRYVPSHTGRKRGKGDDGRPAVFPVEGFEM
jgi:hypothetical protein